MFDKKMTQEEIKIKVPQWLPSLLLIPRSEVGGSDLVGGERGGGGQGGMSLRPLHSDGLPYLQ